MMSKEEDVKFLKIQTCVLKVNIHCEGCKQKVKKLLQKIDGVYTTAIDAEQGKVTVSGDVDPATLVKKLAKAGKPAELLYPTKPASNHRGLNGQFQKMQLDGGKGGQKGGGKAQKGGVLPASGGGNNPKVSQKFPAPANLQQPQMIKSFKDLNFPQMNGLKMPVFPKNQKDQKNAKFYLPEGENGSDYDEEFDDDDDDDFDDDFDDIEGFDDDFDDDPRIAKMKAMNGPPAGMIAGKNGGGGPLANNSCGKKGAGDVSAQKGGPAVIDGKNGNASGKKGGGGGNKNQAGSGGGMGNGGGGGGCAGNVVNPKVASDGAGVNIGENVNRINNANINMSAAAFGKHGGSAKNMSIGGGGGPPMNQPAVVPHPMVSQMANMNFPMSGQLGNMPGPAAASAVQGLPLPAGGPPPGCFPGGAAITPEMFAAANPYQQQYLAAMMLQQQQQQQQQRMMMMMNGQQPACHPMAFAHRPPPPPVTYVPPPPPPTEYTHFFSDENTNSCVIM